MSSLACCCHYSLSFLRESILVIFLTFLEVRVRDQNATLFVIGQKSERG
jgi:hypothetical protein